MTAEITEIIWQRDVYPFIVSADSTIDSTQPPLSLAIKYKQNEPSTTSASAKAIVVWAASLDRAVNQKFPHFPTGVILRWYSYAPARLHAADEIKHGTNPDNLIKQFSTSDGSNFSSQQIESLKKTLQISADMLEIDPTGFRFVDRFANSPLQIATMQSYDYPEVAIELMRMGVNRYKAVFQSLTA